MDITQITVRKRFASGNLAAIVSVIFDDTLAVHDIKIAYRNDGSIIAVMPKDGQGRDVVHPLNMGFRSRLEAEINKTLF
ncbi:MAG: hypothetical protein E7597_07780 [Ruminococcaceae bacterium]|nr:hypothetical protein [Oscillospiraceae bacterium]